MAVKKSRKTLASERKEILEELENDILREDDIETPAGQTIVSKTGVLANVAQMISGMSPEDLSKWYYQSVAQIGHEADAIPDGTADKNRASVAMKVVAKEEMEDLFNGTELTEEFKERATVLFEAAVNSKVAEIEIELQEQYEELLEETMEQLTEEMVEKIDSYLTATANEWLEENEIAVEHGIKSELTESLLEGLRNLLVEHDILVPEESQNALEIMTEKIQELESRLDAVTSENIQMESALEELVKNVILSDVAEGLTLKQTEDFEILAEDIDFDDPESYKKKLEILREHYVDNSTGTKKKTVEATDNSILSESFEGEEEPEKILTPEIARYSKAISRTVVKR